VNVGQLTGVHGIGQQYLGREEILGQWRPALRDGLEVAAGRRPRRPDLDLAFYGHLFRPDPRDEAKGSGDGETEARLADIDDEELAELTETVEEIVSPADLANAEAGADKGLWLPVSVQRLVGAVERRFPPTSGVLFLGDLRQVRRYLRDGQLKMDVDQITAEAAAGAAVLIGHSLGSVVAYEFLRQHPGHSVKLLLTLGSPLGLKMVRNRLPPGEPGVAHWANVRDRHDPVTAAGALGQWYPGAADRLADNGSKPHQAERYLNSKAVGRALLEVLPELGQ
jgi:pimeloyl-ACP methyl ester carboxylesterase